MKECDNSTRKIHISSNFILSISLLIMFDTLLLRPSLHWNTLLHFTTLHPTTFHYIYRHFTSFHLHFTTLSFSFTHVCICHDMRRIVTSRFVKIWTYFTLRINISASWTKINLTFKGKINIRAFRNFGNKNSSHDAQAPCQFCRSLRLSSFTDISRDALKAGHVVCLRTGAAGIFISEDHFRSLFFRERDKDATTSTQFSWSFDSLSDLCLSSTQHGKTPLFRLKIVVYGGSEFVHFFFWISECRDTTKIKRSEIF